MAKQTFTTGQVLTAAQMTSLQQTAMLGGAASAKTASYTLVAADAGTAISMSNAGATTITVNTALFAAGDTVHITNLGAGVCTITAGTATVNSSASLALAQYESGFLDFTSTSEAIFVKGAGAAAASGGMTLLSDTVASANSSISFSSLGSYKQLLMVWSGIYHSDNTTRFNLRFNNDASNIYAQKNFGFNGSSVTCGGQNRTSVGGDALVVFGYGTGDSTLPNTCYGSILIDNYTSTTRSKFYNLIGAYYDNASGAVQQNILGNYNTTTAITSLDIFRATGTGTISNVANTSIRLYGIS